MCLPVSVCLTVKTLVLTTNDIAQGVTIGSAKVLTIYTNSSFKHVILTTIHQQKSYGDETQKGVEGAISRRITLTKGDGVEVAGYTIKV